VPVAAGADGSLGGYRFPPSFSDSDRYWPEPVAPEPTPPGAALDLLERSVEMGATVVGVGPWTNLALLEASRPGLLASTRLVVLGGYVRSVRAGLPCWEPDMDYNVQQDTLAARIVWERCDPLVVQFSVSLEVTLRETHLPQLREGGALARLIFPESPSGKPTRVVTAVDGPCLEREWVQAVRAVGTVE
jgi:inosine-uridine nucleoside N-ribohydrolase